MIISEKLMEKAFHENVLKVLDHSFLVSVHKALLCHSSVPKAHPDILEPVPHLAILDACLPSVKPDCTPG